MNTGVNIQRDTDGLEVLAADLRRCANAITGRTDSGARRALAAHAHEQREEERALAVVKMLEQLERHPFLKAYRHFLQHSSSAGRSYTNLLPGQCHIKGGGGLVFTEDGFAIGTTCRYETSIGPLSVDGVMTLMENFRTDNYLKPEYLLKRLAAVAREHMGMGTARLESDF